MYIGEIAEANPTPIPPIIRYRLNAMSRPRLDPVESKNKNSGKPDRIAEIINRIAATCNDFFLPKRLEKLEDNRPPIIQPISALETVMP